MENNNNIDRTKLNNPNYVPTLTHGICECAGNLPDDIKLPGGFPCEAGEKTNLMGDKNIGTQFDDETMKVLAEKWKELQKD